MCLEHSGYIGASITYRQRQHQRKMCLAVINNNNKFEIESMCGPRGDNNNEMVSNLMEKKTTK